MTDHAFKRKLLASENVASFDADNIIESYQQSLRYQDDPILKINILQRIATLKLNAAERLDIANAGLSSDNEIQEQYQQSIDAYQALLKLNKTNDVYLPERDRIHYSLAKAYALKGDAEKSYKQLSILVDEFPDSLFWLEAQFRRGEYLFVQSDFDHAGKVFQQLIDRNNQLQLVLNQLIDQHDSKPNDHTANQEILHQELYLNALYMLGWSQFKNNLYKKSVDSFVALIDQKQLLHDGLLEDITSAKIIGQVYSQNYILGADAFNQKNKIIDDAVRAIILSIAYLPINDVIPALKDSLQHSNFAHWIYAELAQHYFKQERYSDAASVYAEYELAFPDQVFAPWFVDQHIAVLQYADFNQKALDRKAYFVKAYLPDGRYFAKQNNTQLIQQYTNKKLFQYFDDLSSYYHATARRYKKKSRSQDANQLRVKELFDYAIYWYQLKLNHLKDGANKLNTYYLLAECLNEAGYAEQAIQAYEDIAYKDMAYKTKDITSDFDKFNEAAYASLLIYNDQVKSLIDQIDRDKQAQKNNTLPQDKKKLTALRDKKIASALRFADSYPNDKRVKNVLLNTVQDLKQQAQWPLLIDVADRLLLKEQESKQSIDDALVLWLTSANAAYTLSNYSEAERRYEQALQIMRVDKEQLNTKEKRYLTKILQTEYQNTLDNYATTIYKQAEHANQQDDKDQAIFHFQRLAKLAPNSHLYLAARRDVIILFEQTAQWKNLKLASERFVNDFPKHPERFEMQLRLLKSNIELNEWQLASDLASEIASVLDQQTDKKMVMTLATVTTMTASELRAASIDYAFKAGNKRLAIQRLNQFIQYEKHIDEALYENHFKLAQLYQQISDRNKELKVYQRIATLPSRTELITDRMTYILAHSETQLADLAFDQFKKIKLTHPLDVSLPKKRQALENTLAQYEKIETYAIEEYALQATQKKAEIYLDFADAIMTSERPKDLDELALEEYEFLLEDQAYPFEEQAIELYEINVKRAWQGLHSSAIKQSYQALKKIMPARYNKPEISQ